MASPNNSPRSFRGIFGISICVVGLLLGIILWQIPMPTVENAQDGADEIGRYLTAKTFTLYGKDGADELGRGRDESDDVKAIDQDPVADTSSDDSAAEDAGSVEESSAETGASTEQAPQNSPETALRDFAEPVPVLPMKWTESGNSFLHRSVMQKTKTLKLHAQERDCFRAMNLTAEERQDPFGPPLWKKLAWEHRRSKFGDCRPEGKGCNAFVAQGFQDLFLYTALWRHLKRRGVYIDLAANSWKYISNTFFADHCLKWDGVCIEANPMYYEGLDLKRRCMVEKTCIAEKKKTVTFNMQGVFGGIQDDMRDHHKKIGGAAPTTLTCVALSKIFERHGVTHVDYMNLDVEGAELHCLQGVDWKVVTIDVIGVEFNSKLKPVQDFLEARGYVETVMAGHDVMFVRKAATSVLDLLQMWRRDYCPRINQELAQLPWMKGGNQFSKC